MIKLCSHFSVLTLHKSQIKFGTQLNEPNLYIRNIYIFSVKSHYYLILKLLLEFPYLFMIIASTMLSRKRERDSQFIIRYE